jgi:cephalosporin-C deacetylase-like acetyl esterase
MPLDIQQVTVEVRNDIQIHDISYASPNGATVSAYLVVPCQGNSFAGVIFLHGGEQDRSAFLHEALSLAELGAVSLLIDEPSVRAMPLFAEPEADCERYIQVILKLRRGLDLLSSRPDIDPKRIGYVGLSFGAWMGGMLSGVDDRVKTYILIAGTSSMTDFWRSHNHPMVIQIRESLTAEQLERFLQVTAPLDAIHFIGRASASLFFQFGYRDVIVSESAALRYIEAANAPKLVKWYEAQHHDIFVNKAARDDRVEWLQKELLLGTPNGKPNNSLNRSAR